MKVGVLGGGQLGRMLALAGYPLGMTFRFLDPAADAPAGQVGELRVGAFDDQVTLDRFADGLDLVTYEFENVPVASVQNLARRLPVFPPVHALETGQDRAKEKELFTRLGIPVPQFAPVEHKEHLAPALAKIGVPCILKTRRLGYDGKGQAVIRSAPSPGDHDGLAQAWTALGRAPCLLERLIPFTREVSILGVRARDGATVFCPLVENVHGAGILRTSRVPCAVPHLERQARAYAQGVLEALDYVGVLVIEFFVEDDQRLLANELAPRVHNSGHWTIDGAVTSQFENHVRAIGGLPLGDCSAPRPCAMVNLIGTTPDLGAMLSIPGAKVHLYGKEPRPGRKLGHVNILGDDEHQVRARVEMVLRLIGNKGL